MVEAPVRDRNLADTKRDWASACHHWSLGIVNLRNSAYLLFPAVHLSLLVGRRGSHRSLRFVVPAYTVRIFVAVET
jgi:hypothetical protein